MRAIRRQYAGLYFFSSRRRHTRPKRDWSSDVCSSDLRALATARRSRQALGHDEIDGRLQERDGTHGEVSRIEKIGRATWRRNGAASADKRGLNEKILIVVSMLVFNVGSKCTLHLLSVA